jgi:hypothetical protein
MKKKEEREKEKKTQLYMARLEHYIHIAYLFCLHACLSSENITTPSLKVSKKERSFGSTE